MACVGRSAPPRRCGLKLPRPLEKPHWQTACPLHPFSLRPSRTRLWKQERSQSSAAKQQQTTPTKGKRGAETTHYDTTRRRRRLDCDGRANDDPETTTTSVPLLPSSHPLPRLFPLPFSPSSLRFVRVQRRELRHKQSSDPASSVFPTTACCPSLPQPPSL